MARITDGKDGFFAHRRFPLRIQIGKRFSFEQSEDVLAPLAGETRLLGRGSRFAYEVFDSTEHCCFTSSDGIEVVLRETPTRQQVKAVFFEDDRSIPRVVLQRFGSSGKPSGEQINLNGDEVVLLREFLDVIGLADLPTEGEGTRFSPAQVREVLGQAEARHKLYQLHRDELYELIEGDVDARDVIAINNRRGVLEEFRLLLEDDAYFDARAESESGPESVWQNLFERNQWLLGMNLSLQFLRSWDPRKLEQTVRGFSVSGGAKRADALMATAGIMRSLCFVEIKTHRTDLLRRSPYRREAWAASEELAGGVAQLHATVENARDDSGAILRERDSEGAETGESALLCRPRSVLVIGSLREFREAPSVNHARYRSFEGFRRALAEPEIVTFDELYERARLSLELVSEAQNSAE